MVRVVVFAEGQTEEQFIRRVVAPTLYPMGIFLNPQLLPTSKGNWGGAVSFGRLKYHARNTLRTSSAPILSTFLDLYALDTDFPGFQEAVKIADVRDRATHLGKALHGAIVAVSGCRAERFIPHIQPAEFEGLLFSDVAALCAQPKEWKRFRTTLTRIRESFETPEHINDSPETKPSKRLEDILSPKYRKTRHGPLAAGRITLPVMERECAHFGKWMERLRGLSAQAPGEGK